MAASTTWRREFRSMPVGALGNRTPTWPGDIFHFTQSELEGSLVDVVEDETK